MRLVVGIIVVTGAIDVSELGKIKAALHDENNFHYWADWRHWRRQRPTLSKASS
jgi:hypothetical protein